ncbi:hypothetical protein F5Y16DRAFT_399999 [Xylariaceae sp. FL0255]|nr:hypothetical protein F5Y16DRAFT_399999 [Xylariaceae sp. FL0255]
MDSSLPTAVSSAAVSALTAIEHAAKTTYKLGHGHPTMGVTTQTVAAAYPPRHHGLATALIAVIVILIATFLGFCCLGVYAFASWRQHKAKKRRAGRTNSRIEGEGSAAGGHSSGLLAPLSPHEAEAF